ncbi:uncharacterized protein LOC131225197 [Magnolia sinica]|uniref:uncharacterized protein LOC131225197 n=1 Tax=Magnolia sinica TaxID=86752 RepID=UPI00265B1276|nr:uncharacterized protein LOC131225197 [Magnolia sinica]
MSRLQSCPKPSFSSPSDLFDPTDALESFPTPSITDGNQGSSGSEVFETENVDIQVAVDLLLSARFQVLNCPNVDLRWKKLLDCLIKSAIEPLDWLPEDHHGSRCPNWDGISWHAAFYMTVSRDGTCIACSLLYKGTLRVLLLLLHDFPEFLCGYYFSFCDVIPPSCIQMRNTILCAFPHNMELPYPLTPNLKVDLVPKSSQSPCILSEVDGAIKAMQIKTKIDEYLKSWKKGSPLLAELNQSLLLPQSEAALAGTRYNVPLINSLVLYSGMQAIYTTPVDDFSVSPTMDIFQVMITDLDPEGRYLFLNSVANQLRYPSSHTFYFSLVLLYLFSEASQDVIQEQIMRVLLECLIVKQPHPWSLLATFIKLVKNPQNDFWNRPFFRHERKIVDELFELLARPYGSMMTMDGGMVPGGVSDNAH